LATTDPAGGAWAWLSPCLHRCVQTPRAGDREGRGGGRVALLSDWHLCSLALGFSDRAAGVQRLLATWEHISRVLGTAHLRGGPTSPWDSTCNSPLASGIPTGMLALVLSNKPLSVTPSRCLVPEKHSVGPWHVPPCPPDSTVTWLVLRVGS